MCCCSLRILYLLDGNSTLTQEMMNKIVELCCTGGVNSQFWGFLVLYLTDAYFVILVIPLTKLYLWYIG